jgi:aspartyl-tRNA(Asn)/glutamyl-tRNA(Gln) amidotransferase subunit A
MFAWDREFDALVAPTVAIAPPAITSFPADGDPSDPDDQYYTTTNLKALRNTSVGNFLDACAISLPLCGPDQRSESPAVGLMLMAAGGSDQRLLRTAAQLEPICATTPW